ncbi:MAG: DUF4097 family beta strand repeat protein [Lachnospiraceae bacterium]|nr:DUF4097 family beta strand repeat protein [Candidatus Colinaster scatohippi]
MRRFNKILLLVSMWLFIIGVILTVFGAINGGFSKMANIHPKSSFISMDFDFSSSNEEAGGDYSVSEGEEVLYDATGIKKFEISAGACILNVKSSEDGKIHVWSSKNAKVKSSCNNGNLVIKMEDAKKVHNDRIINILMPENMHFEEVELELGAVDMTSDIQFECDDFNMKVGAGTVTLSGLKAEKIKVDEGAGEIAITRAFLGDADFDIGMGNLTLDGDIEGDLDLDMSMGNVSITLDSDIKNHNYNIDCAAGNVKIGNEDISTLASSKHIDNGAESNFDIDCQMGNLDIIFADKM